MYQTQGFFQKRGKLEARKASASTVLPTMLPASSTPPYNSLGGFARPKTPHTHQVAKDSFSLPSLYSESETILHND